MRAQLIPVASNLRKFEHHTTPKDQLHRGKAVAPLMMLPATFPPSRSYISLCVSLCSIGRDLNKLSPG